jgi:hypothetical protein
LLSAGLEEALAARTEMEKTAAKERKTNRKLIAKPKGTAGVDFKLKEAVKLETNTARYNNILVRIHGITCLAVSDGAPFKDSIRGLVHAAPLDLTSFSAH